jgi:hypothetical protein
MSGALRTLSTLLSEYDGKATTYLGEAEAQCSQQEGYLDALIELLAMREGHVANGASWLIRSALEQELELAEGQVRALIAQLSSIEDWAAQLHICQLVRHLTIPASDAGTLAGWLSKLLEHKRPFLRAWSLDALGALATQHAEYSAIFNTALKVAHEDDAASVRARTRQLSPR